MTLSKMLKQCKKNKHIQIMSYGDYDYLSDGSVAGVIDADVDDWTAEDCAAAIGISDDDRDTYIFPPCAFSYIEEIDPVVPMEFSVELPSGAVIQPFMLADRRIFFVNAELLDIFGDCHDKRYFFGHDTLIIMRDTFTLPNLKIYVIIKIEQRGQVPPFGLGLKSVDYSADFSFLLSCKIVKLSIFSRASVLSLLPSTIILTISMIVLNSSLVISSIVSSFLGTCRRWVRLPSPLDIIIL